MSVETLESRPSVAGIAPKVNHRQVADHFGVSDMTIYRWIKAGLLPPPTKIGSKKYWLAETISRVVAPSEALGTANDAEGA